MLLRVRAVCAIHPKGLRDARRVVLTSSLLLLGALLGIACDEGFPATTGTLYDQRLRSEVVDDDYVLRIRLPPGYDDEPMLDYPVVYQLDPNFAGLQQFEITAGYISDNEDRGLGPAAIVVGIDYDDPQTRFRDYPAPETLDPDYGGDGADRFYRALRDEIIPYVDESLRTRPEQRFLVGHSMGGFFALYAAFRHDPGGPALLAGAIANDPSYSQDLLTYERWHAERADALPMRLYRAIATYNGPLQTLSHDWMTERLQQRRYEGLEDRGEVFETDHGGVVEPGYVQGLRFILGGDQ